MPPRPSISNKNKNLFGDSDDEKDKNPSSKPNPLGGGDPLASRISVKPSAPPSRPSNA